VTVRPVEKMFYVGKRNPALRAEDFPARWKQHAVLSATVATVADAVLGMAQCSRVLDDDVLPGLSNEYDGVSVLTITDPERIFASQKEKLHIDLLLPDELLVFTDYVSKSTVIAHETLIHSRAIDRAKNKFVLVDILMRRPGLSDGDFTGRWHDHAEAVCASLDFRGTVLRYAQNTIYGSRPPGHDYDAVAEFWFESLEDVVSFFSVQTRRQLDAGLASFADMNRRLTLLTYVSHAFYRQGQLAAV
jgi:hypothetical protein